MSDTAPSPPTTPPTADRGAELMEKLRGMGPGVALLTIASLTLPALGGFLVLGFATSLKPYVERLGDSAWLIYAPLFAVLTGCALMPTYALSFAAGVFFGSVRGTTAAMLGVVGGSLIGYLWAYFIARRRVLAQIESDERASTIRRALVDRGPAESTGVVALLRFPPNSPFAFTNLVMSSAGVAWLPFVIGTLFGMLPRTALAAWIGHRAGEMSKLDDSLGPWKWVGLGATAVVLIVVYSLFSRWVRAALEKKINAARTTPQNPA